jgi:hypothetical protein
MAAWASRIRFTDKGKVHAADWKGGVIGWQTACHGFVRSKNEPDLVDGDVSCQTCRRVMDEAERRRGW